VHRGGVVAGVCVHASEGAAETMIVDCASYRRERADEYCKRENG
jgi:hypothetical protein